MVHWGRRGPPGCAAYVSWLTRSSTLEVRIHIWWAAGKVNTANGDELSRRPVLNTSRASRIIGYHVCRHTHPPDLPYEASLSFRTSVRLPASSPHGLAAHAVAFDLWLPSEGPTRGLTPSSSLPCPTRPLLPPAPAALLRNRVVFLANIPTEATEWPERFVE